MTAVIFSPLVLPIAKQRAYNTIQETIPRGREDKQIERNSRRCYELEGNIRVTCHSRYRKLLKNIFWSKALQTGTMSQGKTCGLILWLRRFRPTLPSLTSCGWVLYPSPLRVIGTLPEYAVGDKQIWYCASLFLAQSPSCAGFSLLFRKQILHFKARRLVHYFQRSSSLTSCHLIISDHPRTRRRNDESRWIPLYCPPTCFSWASLGPLKVWN